MLTICCVKQGDKYTSEQVNILFDMVCRNLTDTEFRFACFTDDPSGLNEKICVFETDKDLDGWWTKLALFKRGVFGYGERVVYLDLSCVIVGSIHFLAEYEGGFAILRDFYRPNGLQSAIMAWPGGWGAHIWDEWDRAGRPKLMGGDQEWLERMAPGAACMQDLWPGLLVSYKLHCLGRARYPTGARIVKFHGLPKPEDCDDAWVRHLYKVGAGSADEILLQTNVAQDALCDSVRENSRRDVPWLGVDAAHERAVALVGGGPSLERTLPAIRALYEVGASIWAMNGSAKWLKSNGITADVHVLLDAREDNVRFVDPDTALSYRIASQCSPKVFDATDSRPVTLFHAYNGDIEHAIENPRGKNLTLVASGSTVGLAAMAIAYAEGYRTMHLFGYDSSYSEGAHHAYEQNLNNGETLINATVGEKTFVTASWMASQANEFQHIASDLANGGAQIVVHGDGLLRAVADAMAALDYSGLYKRIDGVLWPASDKVASQRVMEDASDIGDVLKFVPGRDIAVQAGGNVGVYPQRLGQQFKRVYTFEPDRENYACMQENAPAANVLKFRAALGEERGKCGLARIEENAGAHYICSGDDTPVVTIDELGLDGCDLIMLDVEGTELAALKGARNTIARFRPVVVAEDKGLSERYGVSEGAIADWLGREFGYKPIGRVGHDVVLSAQ